MTKRWRKNYCSGWRQRLTAWTTYLATQSYSKVPESTHLITPRAVALVLGPQVKQPHEPLLLTREKLMPVPRGGGQLVGDGGVAVEHVTNETARRVYFCVLYCAVTGTRQQVVVTRLWKESGTEYVGVVFCWHRTENLVDKEHRCTMQQCSKL